MNAPTREGARRLVDCDNMRQAFQSAEFKERIGQLAPKHMTAERLFRIFQQAATKNPDIYQVDVRQACGQFFALANLGLEPNTPLNHAYLITFRDRIWNPQTRRRDIETIVLNTVIGYAGYAELLWRSGVVSNIHADVVRPGDDFAYHYGTDAFLKHRKGTRPQGMVAVPTQAYAHVDLKLENGGKGQAFEVMEWSEVLDIRNESQGYQKALAAKEEAAGKYVPKAWSQAPWVKHEAEMAKKTPFRRLVKWMRKSPELAAAAELEDAQESGRAVDWDKVVIEGEAVSDGLPLLEESRGVDMPTSGFTDRRDPVPAQGQQASGQTQQQPPRQPRQESPPRQAGPPDDRWGPPAGEPPRQSPPPGFSAYLVNLFGDPDPDQPFTNPVLFARALAQLCAKEDVTGIFEANADGISDAEASSEEAAGIIRDIRKPKEEAPRRDPWWVVMPQNAQGKPYANGYIASCRQMLASVTKAEQLQHFIEVNAETFGTLNPAAQGALQSVIAERRGQLGLNSEEPVSQQAETPPPAGARDDSEEEANWKRARQTVTDFEKAVSLTELQLIPRNAAVGRFLAKMKESFPKIAEFLDEKYNARVAALKGA